MSLLRQPLDLGSLVVEVRRSESRHYQNSQIFSTTTFSPDLDSAITILPISTPTLPHPSPSNTIYKWYPHYVPFCSDFAGPSVNSPSHPCWVPSRWPSLRPSIPTSRRQQRQRHSRSRQRRHKRRSLKNIRHKPDHKTNWHRPRRSLQNIKRQ
jgi:hypothetical protein